VKADGQPRSVVSADLIRVDRAKGSAPQSPVAALIASNVSAINARYVLIAVDQTLITPGTLTPLLRTASQFVDRLAPADYAAFIGFPEPGPRVDFTTDKTAVRKAMQTISIGQASRILTGRFDISLYEAFAITGPERAQDADRDKPPGRLSDRRRVRDRFRKFEWPVSSDTVVNRSTCVHIPGHLHVRTPRSHRRVIIPA